MEAGRRVGGRGIRWAAEGDRGRAALGDRAVVGERRRRSDVGDSYSVAVGAGSAVAIVRADADGRAGRAVAEDALEA